MVKENINTENKSNTPKEIRDLWQTPKSLFEKLDREFDFGCDVAASDENTLCDSWFTEKDNAIDPDWVWGLSNWCNPPYSDIGPWVDKAAQQHDLGKTTVMLVPADTSVKWFKRAYETCNDIRFISGRLAFINADTQKPVSGNNKGSVLLIWRGGCPASVKSVSLIDRSELV